MIQWRSVPAVVGTALLAWVAPAAAAVSRPDDARAVTSSDRQFEIDGHALDTLLERSGLKVQLESLSRASACSSFWAGGGSAARTGSP